MARTMMAAPTGGFCALLGSIGLAALVTMAPRADGIPADGGYECDVLPAAAGWGEAGDSFLGDHVTVADGVLTYDGNRSRGLHSNGMALAAIPLTGDSATVEFRVRVRRAGGDPDHSYQYFLSAHFRTASLNVAAGLGHTYPRGQGRSDDVLFKAYMPRTHEDTAVPTTTGRWETNEWITIRTICRPATGGRFHLACWLSGPAGAVKGFETTRDPDPRGPVFALRVNYGARDAEFDLDYIRWSNRVVPWGTPLGSAAAGAPPPPAVGRRGAAVAIASIRPERGPSGGGQMLTIRGSGFQGGLAVKFDTAAAAQVSVRDAATITCITPAPQGRWSGLADVTVLNPDGGVATAARSYTFERGRPVSPKALGWLIGCEYDHYNLPVAIQKLEEMPFHGALIRLGYSQQLFNGTVSASIVHRDLEMLERTRFRRFRHNWLHTNMRGWKEIGPSLGFFEDWSGIVHGFGLHAGAARQSGCEGLWLDVEDYAQGAGADLSFATRNDRTKSLEQCRKQVRLRGRQLMLAALEAYPDIRIMTAFGLGAATDPTLDLLPAFIDGMLEAVASDPAYERAQVIDGYEAGYYITTPADYQMAYDRMRRPGGVAYQRTSRDSAWAEYGRGAFGVYCDRPLADFRTMLASAMGRTDEYVWVYTGGSFFRGSGFPSLRRETEDRRLGHYVEILAELTGMPHAPMPGRTMTIGYWRMEEARGLAVHDASGLGYDGALSSDQVWSHEAPWLPGVAENLSALDLRGRCQHLNVGTMGVTTDAEDGFPRHSRSNHLGNLYFTDHTVEFSFLWDGRPSPHAQYLYGAAGGRRYLKSSDSFSYGCWIPAGTWKLVHWQRGDHGGRHGGVAIDLGAAERAGLCQLGRWTSIAILVDSIHCARWRLFLNGIDVTNRPWAGPYEGHATVEGFQQPPGQRWPAWWPADLVIGARNVTERGVVAHFDGMLDEVRLSAGLLAPQKLLSWRDQPARSQPGSGNGHADSR